MKIVINTCYGGFSISREAAEFMAARGNEQAKAELTENPNGWYGYGYTEQYRDGYKRTDPDLIAAVEALQDKADGDCADLKVVEIPDDIIWYIGNYDGIETIHQEHQSWG